MGDALGLGRQAALDSVGRLSCHDLQRLRLERVMARGKSRHDYAQSVLTYAHKFVYLTTKLPQRIFNFTNAATEQAAVITAPLIMSANFIWRTVASGLYCAYDNPARLSSCS